MYLLQSNTAGLMEVIIRRIGKNVGNKNVNRCLKDLSSPSVAKHYG